jgi:hypothetical protein
MNISDPLEKDIYNTEISNIYSNIFNFSQLYKLKADSVCLFDVVFKKFLCTKLAYIFVPLEPRKNKTGLNE